MNLKKQKLYFQYLLSSPEMLSKCSGMLDPTYFDPELRQPVRFLTEYHLQHDSAPPVDLLEAETDYIVELVDIDRDVVEHTSSELATFCRKRAIEQFAIATVKKLNSDESFNMEEALQDALSVGLSPDLGSNYYEDPQQRMEDEEDIVFYSTGFPTMDKYLGGGLARQTLTLFTANSGNGKSVMLANISRNLALQGLDILFVTLELSQRMTEDRFDMIVTDDNLVVIKRDKQKAAEKIVQEGKRSGSLHIKKFPMSGTTAADIKRYIKEYVTAYGKPPDAVAIDYLDVMSPNSGKNSKGDVFNDDKQISEEVKSIGEYFDCILLSASQQNRDGIDVIDPSQRVIAGGISKINTSDNTISLIGNDQLRAQGKLLAKMIKVRSGPGTGGQMELSWPAGKLRIVDANPNALTNDQQQYNQQENDDWGDVSPINEDALDDGILSFMDN